MELKQSIIPFLDPKALISLRQTNRQWHTLIDHECKRYLRQVGIPLGSRENPCEKYACLRSLKEAGYPLVGGKDACKRWKNIQGGYNAIFNSLSDYGKDYVSQWTMGMMQEHVNFLKEVKAHPERWTKETLYDELYDMGKYILDDSIWNEEPAGYDFFFWNVYHRPEWRELISFLPNEEEIMTFDEPKPKLNFPRSRSHSSSKKSSSKSKSRSRSKS